MEGGHPLWVGFAEVGGQEEEQGVGTVVECGLGDQEQVPGAALGQALNREGPWARAAGGPGDVEVPGEARLGGGPVWLQCGGFRRGLEQFGRYGAAALLCADRGEKPEVGELALSGEGDGLDVGLEAAAGDSEVGDVLEVEVVFGVLEGVRGWFRRGRRYWFFELGGMGVRLLSCCGGAVCL